MTLPKISTQGFLIIAALLQIVWGFVPSASQFVINEIPLELYIAIRWTISGCIFAAYLFVTKSWKKVSLRDLYLTALLGLLGYGLASVGMLNALKIGGVTNFALMGALSPAITSIVAILILKERPAKLFFIALPLSIFGLLLLVAGKYELSSFKIAGTSAGLIIGAYILEAFVFILSKKFKAAMSSAQYLAIAQIAAASIMWILQVSVFHQTAAIQNLTLKGLLAAIFVSVVACVLCYAVLYWLLNHIDGHRLALFDGFHTISATLFGCILFREKLSLVMLLGGLFILCGLVTGNLPRAIVEEIPE